ncbi:MAG: DUF4411 family protein, partial [Anaerolineae bacterium]
MIHLHRHFGRHAISQLRRMANNGTLKLPEGVIREILRGTDRLALFVKKYRADVEVAIKADPRLQHALSELEGKYGDRIRMGPNEYPGFWHSRAGRKSVDAQVVAVAKVNGWTVVSDDRAVRLACLQENVPCIGWTE